MVDKLIRAAAGRYTDQDPWDEERATEREERSQLRKLVEQVQ